MPEDPQMITDRIQKAHAGETMSDIETPEEIPQEEATPKEDPAFSIKIAAIADGKHLDVDGALILFLADGTVRWTAKQERVLPDNQAEWTEADWRYYDPKGQPDA